MLLRVIMMSCTCTFVVAGVVSSLTTPAHGADDPTVETTKKAEGPGESGGGYITPIFGTEYVRMRNVALDTEELGIDTTDVSEFGLAYGAHAGFAVGVLRLGAMYQRTDLMDDSDMSLNKLYVELGLMDRSDFLGINISLAGGWAFYEARSVAMRNGGGARATFALDFFVDPHVSIGPGASADVAGFDAPDEVSGMFGFTGNLRLGIHLW